MNNLISFYQQRLGLQDAIFTRIDHQDATVALVYSIIQITGEKSILKVCPRSNDFLREHYFLTYFANKLPIPNIINTVEPEENIYGALLLNYLPGKLLNPDELTESLAYEIGSLLAQIHMHKTHGFGDLIKPSELSHDPRIWFTMKFEEGLAECKDHLPSKLLNQCQDYFNTHIDDLKLVDGPCIVHRDFRPGNIIVNKGTVSGIIDWSCARAGFAEEDFCLLEHGDWLINTDLKNAFLAGYATIRAVPNYDAIMPLLRLSRAIASIGFTVKSGTWQTRDTKLYQLNRAYLENFFKNMINSV